MEREVVVDWIVISYERMTVKEAGTCLEQMTGQEAGKNECKQTCDASDSLELLISVGTAFSDKQVN